MQWKSFEMFATYELAYITWWNPDKSQWVAKLKLAAPTEDCKRMLVTPKTSPWTEISPRQKNHNLTESKCRQNEPK